MISATGSCDLFFNCKYSARHVEDKVRKECHDTTEGTNTISSADQKAEVSLKNSNPSNAVPDDDE